MKAADIRKIYLAASEGANFYPKDMSCLSKTKKNNRNICITGGIGDFLAIQRFTIDTDFNGTYFLVTRSWHEIGEIIRFTNSLSDYVAVLKEFPSDWYSFISKQHFTQCADVRKIKYPPDFINAEDFSISKVFPYIHKNKPALKSNLLIDKDCYDISAYKLPKEYIAIVMQSNRDTGHASRGRNFTQEEVEKVCSIDCIPKVCVFCQCSNPHPGFIHLKNTTVLESIQILKNASGYIGVDSWLSVLAGWTMPSERIKIKCINSHGIENACCYWPLLDPEKAIVSHLTEIKWGA